MVVYLVLDATNYPVACFESNMMADEYIAARQESNLRKLRIRVKKDRPE